MTKLERFADALQQHIRPGSFPVAIKMLKEGEPIPDRVKRPAEDLGFQAAVCQGFAIARRYGWPIAIGRDDLSCPLAKAVFGFAPPLDYYVEGHACAGMYTETPEAGARTEAETPKFEPGQYEHIVLAPIHRCSFEPDVVLIYGTSGQVMRLLTAALWKQGGRLASSFSGRIDCADAIIETMQTGKPQVILPCYGDRIFAQTEDHEMAFSVPADWMGKIIEGLEGTHTGGIRYPIPSFLRYQSEFPPNYEKMNELWEKQEAESK